MQADFDALSFHVYRARRRFVIEETLRFGRAVRVENLADATDPGHDCLQYFEPFAVELGRKKCDAGRVSDARGKAGRTRYNLRR